MTISKKPPARWCARATSSSSTPAGTSNTRTARTISAARPGFVPSAGEWFVEKKVKVVGHDTQANDHPLATAIGPQRNGPLHPHLPAEYKKWSGGRDWKDDFPEWEPVHRILFKNGILGIENVGGDLDKVTGKRCTFAFFPWNWDRGDGCIIRLVAITDPERHIPHREGGEVLMQVKRFADAKPYEAPNHRAYSSLRLFGAEAGGPKEFVVGLSHFLPGGGAGPDSSPTEKVYFVLAGELTVIAGGKETVLKPNDSCFIGPNEVREIDQPHQRRRAPCWSRSRRRGSRCSAKHDAPRSL